MFLTISSYLKPFRIRACQSSVISSWNIAKKLFKKLYFLFFRLMRFRVLCRCLLTKSDPVEKGWRRKLLFRAHFAPPSRFQIIRITSSYIIFPAPLQELTELKTETEKKKLELSEKTSSSNNLVGRNCFWQTMKWITASFHDFLNKRNSFFCKKEERRGLSG